MIRNKKFLTRALLWAFLALGASVSLAQEAEITYNTHVAKIIN